MLDRLTSLRVFIDVAGTGSLLQVSHTNAMPLGRQVYRVVFLP